MKGWREDVEQGYGGQGQKVGFLGFCAAFCQITWGSHILLALPPFSRRRVCD